MQINDLGKKVGHLEKFYQEMCDLRHELREIPYQTAKQNKSRQQRAVEKINKMIYKLDEVLK